MTRFRMKPLHSLILLVAPLGLGLSMPSCPGQEAVQQELSQVQSRSQENEKKLQALTAQVASMDKDLTEARTLLAQVSQTVLAQKSTLEQMDASMKELAERVDRASSKNAPAKKKK